MAAAVVSPAGGAAGSGGAEDTAEATGVAAAGSLRIDSGQMFCGFTVIWG